MNTERPASPENLSDRELAAACAAARKKASNLLEKSRLAKPGEWSEIAQQSNVAVSEYLALSAERTARMKIRIAALTTEDLDPQADPMPFWLVCVIAFALAAVAVVIGLRVA